MYIHCTYFAQQTGVCKKHQSDLQYKYKMQHQYQLYDVIPCTESELRPPTHYRYQCLSHFFLSRVTASHNCRYSYSYSTIYFFDTILVLFNQPMPMPQPRPLKSKTAATMVGGPKYIGRTKELGA